MKAVKMMKKLLSKMKKKNKDKKPPPSARETADKLNDSAEAINEKINKLNDELLKCRDMLINKKANALTNAVKSRARVLLQHKKMLEAQRDALYDQAFTLEQMTSTTEGIANAQHTASAIKVGSKELSRTLKELNIDKIDKMQEKIQDLASYGSEMHDSLGQNYSVPDDLDDKDVLKELNGLNKQRNSVPQHGDSENAGGTELGEDMTFGRARHGTLSSNRGTDEVAETVSTSKVASINA